ncbi:SH3 domain-binding glutamic acid-rich-like protein 3 [Amphiura filiformis]|uniref:SH3 domain-binding glutamic acid-rich-like protein 3 n=1 Tax=Amphiura filiformis TaxID=82378 RepID=UPI003B224B9D
MTSVTRVMLLIHSFVFLSLFVIPSMGSVKYYYTSVPGNLEVRKQQQKIELVLDSKKIPYQTIDIAQSDDFKAKMREIAGNPKALPPQLTNDDRYCGDYAAFEEAVEYETLEEFINC